MVPRCKDCGLYRMPPSPFCPSCRSQAVAWHTSPGIGSLYSYTVVHQPHTPAHRDHVPYGVGVLTLDDVPIRIIGTIVDADSEDLRVGAEMEVDWLPIEGGHFPVLRFRSS